MHQVVKLWQPGLSQQGAVGGGIAAAGGGAGGCPMNLGVTFKAGVKNHTQIHWTAFYTATCCAVSTGGLSGSAARDIRAYKHRRHTCEGPSSAAVGLLAAVGAMIIYCFQ